MKVVIFGATGMVGSGLVLECLDDPRVESVLIIARSRSGVTHPKLRELIHADLFDLSAVRGHLKDLDACFWCLGVSSVGMEEPEYRRLTHDLTVNVAEVLVAESPRMTFCFVSGEGADSTEQGKTMWARVKGAAENAVLRMPFQAAYVFRPGYIQPMRGVRSRTRLYNAFYAFSKSLYPMFKLVAAKHVTTTEELGKAMIEAAANGYSQRIIDSKDVHVLAAATRRG
jgi:uncharacterized protein YbjT (DUF2867 family)